MDKSTGLTRGRESELVGELLHIQDIEDDAVGKTLCFKVRQGSCQLPLHPSLGLSVEGVHQFTVFFTVT